MKVMIAGGSGFLGKHLIKSLTSDSHTVWVLSRTANKIIKDANVVHWDGQSIGNWGQLVEEMDAIINLSGLSLHSWPWTKRKKQQFIDSRVKPGRVLASAIKEASHRPGVFIQISGINFYGLRGESVADENTPPAKDYLAQLTVSWEDASKSVEEFSVRHVVCRTAPVLAKDSILMRLMALPVHLFVGGRLGSGNQALPWIHIDDHVGAIRFLIDNQNAKGAYNLIAPQSTSNAQFMRTLANVLQRPYWFPVPTFLLRLMLGDMSVLVTEGRFAHPKKLLEQGYTFNYPNLNDALENIFKTNSK